MRTFVNTSRYSVYRLSGKDKKYVAVPEGYAWQIRQYINEYGRLEKVPADKTVKAVFLVNSRDGWQIPEIAEPAGNVPVKQLRFGDELIGG
jgi:hypothetical protein